MSCCPKACDLPLCANAILIGNIDDPDTEVLVYFLDTITGRVEVVEAESDEDGDVLADVEAIKDFFSPNLLYEVKILTSLVNTCDVIPFEPSGAADPVDCMQFQFVNTGQEVESATLMMSA